MAKKVAKKAAKKTTKKAATKKKVAAKKVAKKAAKKAVKIPPAPERDPRLGEKDPKYLEWLKKWHPATYKSKFRNWKGK